MPSGRQTSDLEQQIMLEMHNFARLGDVRRVNYALQGILTTMLPYLQKESDFEEFSNEIDNIMKPNIIYKGQAINGTPGAYTIEDNETKLTVPVERGNQTFAMNVFREYQYQNMNKKLLKLVRRVWRVLQKEGKFNWDAVRSPSPYVRMALAGGAGADDAESSDTTDYSSNFFSNSGGADQ